MGVNRFEDLRVWQAAREQCNRMGTLMNRPDFRRDRALADQMNAASISVMFNISEGFLRRRDRETLPFLRYSFASNGELKAGYYAAEGRKYIGPIEMTSLIEVNERIAKMLRRWEATLQLKDAAGPRTKDLGPKERRTKGRNKHQAPSTRDQS
jgi:four helix bundle protein